MSGNISNQGACVSCGRCPHCGSYPSYQPYTYTYFQPYGGLTGQTGQTTHAGSVPNTIASCGTTAASGYLQAASGHS